MVSAIIEWADTKRYEIITVKNGCVRNEEGIYLFSENRLSIEIVAGSLILHDSEAIS